MNTVMIVEDNMVVATMLDAMVQKLGHTVIGPCVSEEDAFAAIADQTPSHAVLDINLGGDVTSFAVAEALQERGVKIAFSSAYSHYVIPENLALATFMPKPINQTSLETFLGRASAP